VVCVAGFRRDSMVMAAHDRTVTAGLVQRPFSG